MITNLNDVTLYNVELLTLREKIAAFKALFDCINPVVEVKGTFRDKKDNLAFLNLSFHQMDANNVRRRWLTIVCDGEFTALTPVDDVIAEVRLSI